MSPSPDRKSSTSSPRRHSRSPIGKRDSPNSKRVNGWQTFSLDAGGNAQKDFRSHRRNGSRGSKSSNTSPPTNSSGRPSHSYDRGSISYAKHIAFHGGVLSNFHRGKAFTGAAAFKHLLPKLAELNIAHPSIDSIATEIICQHKFICGEQFMMAMKAYLFEMPTLNLAMETPSTLFAEYFANLRAQLYSKDPNPGLAGVSKSPEEYFGLDKSKMMCILATTNPKAMKDYGRVVPNFNPAIWDDVNMAIVTAVCLARAEADPDLANIYKANASSTSNSTLKRHFVEGSAGDRIWGVGLSHEDSHIDEPRNWRGENRLGRCHDEACRLYNNASNDKSDNKDEDEDKKTGTEDSAHAEPAQDANKMQEEQKQDKSESKGETTTNGATRGHTAGNLKEEHDREQNKEKKKNLGTWTNHPWTDVRR